MRYYTGIGSRKTPEHVLEQMASIAEILAAKSVTLRSGGADGADLAFERGCDRLKGAKEIYLPWKGFNDSTSDLYNVDDPEAIKLAGEVYGPSWKYMKWYTKKFMTRNVFQVIGTDLNTKSMCVICWTPDGCTSGETRSKKSGGTGQAIQLAAMRDIPVYNLQNPGTHDQVMKMVEEI